MARTIVSIGLFSAVALVSGAMTVSGLSFTADTVAKVAATTPVKAQHRLPSYIAYMPTVKAEALNIAKSVPVTPVLPTKPPGPLAASPAPAFTHTVAVESLRVRSGPHKTTPQVFALNGGTQVTVIKEDGGWALIMAAGNRPPAGKMSTMIVQSLRENAHAAFAVESSPDKGMSVSIFFARRHAVPN